MRNGCPAEHEIFLLDDHPPGYMREQCRRNQGLQKLPTRLVEAIQSAYTGLLIRAFEAAHLGSKVLQDAYLMEAFRRTSKSSVPLIDGQTLNTVRDYFARSDIFRALCDLVVAL